MSSIAVVGANGFIGSSLKKAFHSKFSQSMGWRLDLDFIDGQWLRQASSSQLRARLGGKGLLHLAENPNVSSYGSEKMVSSQYGNAQKLVRYSSVPKVYLSSYLVYAGINNVGDGGLSETDPVCSEGCYALHKLKVEKLFLDSGGAVIRSSNLYGRSRLRRQSFIDRIIKRLSMDEAVVLENGSNVRDFFYIEQFVISLIKLMQVDDLRGIFNLGSEHGLSLAEAAYLISETMGKAEIRIEYRLSESSRDIRFLDCSKAQSAIGWFEDTSLAFNLPKIL